VTAVEAVPAHLQAALADPDRIPPLLHAASAAYEESVAGGNSPRVQRGLAALAAQAAVAALRLGLLEGKVHVALGSGPGLVAEARPLDGIDALTWIDAWYLTWIADRPDIREDLHRVRMLLTGPEAAVAWVGVLAALDGVAHDAGMALGAAERVLPAGDRERVLLPAAAALLTGDEPEIPAVPGWGPRAFHAYLAQRYG
jgi:hypothetical protein